MKTYLIVMAVLYFIGIVFNMSYLVKGNYPRAVSKSVGEDVYGLLLGIGFLYWVVSLLGQV